MLRSIRSLVCALAIFVMLVPYVAAQNDKVYRGLSTEEAEKLLQELKIEFKKTSAKKGDEHYYDFMRNGYRIRLNYFSRDEMMLDCVFRGAPIDKVNQWNTFTRLSRASFHKDQSGEFTLLEYGLDAGGGITAATFKQFINRFDDELKKYDKFLGNANDDIVLSEVTNDKLENILKTQGINYKTKANTAGVMMYDFELGGQKLRMYNFGGKDLMIDVHFKRIPLDDVNRYNLNRKFVRVVNYRGKDTEYTSLETNLDCVGGVTEGMIRHWIVSFGDDARHFSDYLKKIEAEKK